MKPENKDLIKAILEHSASLQEDILDDNEQMLVSMAFILQVMARCPEFMIFSAIENFMRCDPNARSPQDRKAAGQSPPVRAFL